MMLLVRVELVDVYFVSVYVIKFRITVTVCLLTCKNIGSNAAYAQGRSQKFVLGDIKFFEEV